MVDCKSVVETFNTARKTRASPTKQIRESDLWADVMEPIWVAPEDQFIAQWMPSHLDKEGKEQDRLRVLDSGSVTQKTWVVNAGRTNWQRTESDFTLI